MDDQVIPGTRNGVDPVDQAVGAEIRRARKNRDWTRGHLVSRMQADISDQTLANYEYGIRPCTLRRLADICTSLGVSTSRLVALALQRSGLEANPDTLLVDLDTVIDTTEQRLSQLRRWATNRQSATGSAIAELDRAAVTEMAAFLGWTPDRLTVLLRRFLPESAITS